MALAQYPWQQALVNDLLALKTHLPNGILVHGPRGIGTFECVLAFARSLLCINPNPDGSACGVCKGCRLTKAQTHPDLRYVVSQADSLRYGLPEVDSGSDRKLPTREILIAQTRALTDFLTLTSHEGGIRVVLIYPADQIRAEAAASLLKSLEEPPENTVFILVSDDLDQVLATIRSRCVLVRAQPPTRAQAIAWLSAKGVPDPEQAYITSAAQPTEVGLQDVRFDLTQDSRDRLLKFLSKGRSASLLDATQMYDREMTLSAVALLLSRWGWDLASISQGGMPRYFPQYQQAMTKIVAQTTREKLFTWINTVRDVRRAAKQPLNAKTVITALMISYLRHL